MNKIISTLAAFFILCGAWAGHSSGASLSVQFDPGDFTLTDGGIGDLDPTDGVLQFDEIVDFGEGFGAVHFQGKALYIEGVPYVGVGGQVGRAGFGVSLTDFTATIVRTPTFIRNQMMVIVEGVFTPGIAAGDRGFVTDHLDGFMTIRNDVDRAGIEDLATWAGDPAVSAGHVGIVINPSEDLNESRVLFDLGTVRSPTASGVRPIETVTYQLNLPFLGITANQLELPGSGTALVFPVPEPSSFILLGSASAIGLGSWARRRRCA